MALTSTALTPVNDPNCLDTSNAASKVFEVQSGTPTNKNDADFNNQRLRNQTHTLANLVFSLERKRKNLIATGYGGSSIEQFSTIAETTSSVVFVDFTDASVGDEVRVSLNFDYTVTNVAGDFGLNLASIEDYGGADVTTLVPGTQFYTRYVGAGERRQVVLQGSMTVATAGPLRIVLRGTCPTNSDQLNNFGTGCLIAERTHTGL